MLAISDDAQADENDGNDETYVILSHDATIKDFYPAFDTHSRIYLDVYDIHQIKA